jgi:hypothetical protein
MVGTEAYIDLVERHAEGISKTLLGGSAWLWLLPEVLLEDFVLVFGKTGLDIGANLDHGGGRSWRPSGLRHRSRAHVEIVHLTIVKIEFRSWSGPRQNGTRSVH